jgi:DNA-binding NarL/FixJ family response regulator
MRRDPNPLVDDEARVILQGLANGRSQREIAAELHYNEHAIGNRLARIRQRLGANTTAHAVAIALRKRYIR